MIKWIKKVFYGLLISLGLISLLTAFLLCSTSGLQVLIKAGSWTLPGTLKLSSLQGSALKQFSAAEVDYQWDEFHIRVKNFKLSWELKDLVNKKIRIKSLTADSIEWLPENTLIAKELKLTGQINKANLDIDSFEFNYETHFITSHFQIGMNPPYALSGAAKLNPQAKDPQMIRGVLSLGGVLNQFQWTGEIQGIAQISLDGSLKELNQIQQVLKWRNLQWQKDAEININSPEGRIELSGTLPNLKLIANSKIGWLPNEFWQLKTKITGSFPWQWNIEAFVTPPATQVEGLYTPFKLKGEMNASNQAHLTFSIEPGIYKMAEQSAVSSLKIQGGFLNFNLTPQQLKGKGTIALDQDKKMKLDLNLPQFDLAQGLTAQQKIDAKLDFNLTSLDFLKDLSPEIVNPQGKLNAVIQATGTWGQKKIKSSLKLSQAALTLPSLGLQLKAIELLANINKNHWQAQGTVSSDQSQLALEGTGVLSPSLTGDFSIVGKQFLIMNSKEYQIKISPQLKVALNSSALSINGTVLVPFAQIMPQSFTNSITLPEDVIFKKSNDSQPASPLLNTQMNVQINMGDEVELKVKGLHAILGGTVTLNQPPQGQLNAVGELTVKKGEYKAYGQNLEIERGQLIFTGGRVDNPGINLRASKKIDTSVSAADNNNKPFDFNNADLQTAQVKGNIKVGVEVTGHLNKPKITLFSNPALFSQADILSLLVLGVLSKQANKAGGQLLLAAISSMDLGNGTNGSQLLEQLKKNLGFDLNIQTNSNYNLATNQMDDSTGVVVGKSLSKKIYVSYNVGLSQANPNVLTLKYLLSKFYSIQISNSTTSSAIDLLYTSSK